MSSRKIEPFNFPENADFSSEDWAFLALLRNPFFTSMGVSAITIVVAASVVAQPPSSQPSLVNSAPLNKAFLTARPFDLTIAPDNGVTKADTVGEEFTGQSEEARMARLSSFDAHARELPVQLRVPGSERRMSVGMLATPLPLAIDEPDPVAEGTNAPLHTATATANSKKRAHPGTKAHTVVHHPKHQPQKPAPESMLAKIGHSVKKVFFNAFGLPRTAKNRPVSN